MGMINIDKFIASLIHKSNGSIKTFEWLENALKEQGLEYRNGEIVEVEPEEVKPFSPKFNEGDWVVYNGMTLQIKTVGLCGYLTSGLEFIPFSYDICMHPWTIQDAEPGDMLINNGNIIIFKCIDKTFLSNADYKYIKSFCFFLRNSNGKVFFEGGVYNLDDKFVPATEEQRKALFDAMDKAGYEWDAKALKLEKKEKVNVHEIPSGFWSKEEIDDLINKTNENTKKICKIMKEALFAKMPDIDAMVEEYKKKEDGLTGYYILSESKIAERAYRKGLEDMYHHLKGE